MRIIHTLRKKNYGYIDYILCLDVLAKEHTTMGDDMDWDEIWDGLDNGKNWYAEKYRV